MKAMARGLTTDGDGDRDRDGQKWAEVLLGQKSDGKKKQFRQQKKKKKNSKIDY